MKKLLIVAILLVAQPAAARSSRLSVGSVARMRPLVGSEFHHPAPKGFRDSRCLRLLRRLRVPFRRLKAVRGVATPIRILGNRIGRIRYRQFYGSPTVMIMDCRLATALYRASPIFRVNGIRTVLYSNFYSWRRVEGTTRLSRHALGLAVDIHGFVARNGRRVTVLEDYEKGLGRGRTCEGHPRTWKGRVLRDLVCDLDASNLFDRIVTPDHDPGHRDHIHISTFHPQDRSRKRIYRTVLVETRGLLWPWVLRRPVRARFSLRRIQTIVRRRQRLVRRWYRERRIRRRRRRRR